MPRWPRPHGFRPCLRCRPELAPGLSLMDSSQALAQQAARTIEQAAHDGSALSMPRLAARMGVTDRHLRRIFQQHVGVAPIDYLHHAAPAAGQAAADRHPDAGDAGGAGQRLREPAPLQRRVLGALSHEPERPAPRAASMATTTRSARRRPRCACAWPTGRPISTTRCCASSRRARSTASKRSTARACAARWRCPIGAACSAAGWPGASCRSATRSNWRWPPSWHRSPARWCSARGRRSISTPTRPASTRCSPPCRSSRGPAFACPARSTASKPRRAWCSASRSR